MENFKLSIIIPAYNEEKRIPLFLESLINFSLKNLSNYEILVVNDGSTDNTKKVVEKIKKNYDHVKFISYKNNKGKGHAVLLGVLKSTGDFVIFIDADGSIEPYEILKMLKVYKKYEFDVIIGSRKLEESEITHSQPFSRRMFSKIFNLYSNFFFRLKISDLLCGFKGFKREVAFQIFKDLKAYRWEFDVEILYRIKRRGFKVIELPIKWKHEEGSKIKPLDPILIFLNILKLRLKYI